MVVCIPACLAFRASDHLPAGFGFGSRSLASPFCWGQEESLHKEGSEASPYAPQGFVDWGKKIFGVVSGLTGGNPLSPFRLPKVMDPAVS